jgi:LMBR1 domain-containing protein 1
MTIYIWLLIGVLGTVLLTVLMSYAFVKRYAHSQETSCMTSCPSATSLCTTLFCLLLIPVDIYVVSYDLLADGNHADLALVNQGADLILTLYYSLYGLMLFCGFFLMPFAYFYFEEESEDENNWTRICGAAKYTLGFVVVFAVLLILGLVLKKNQAHASVDWVKDLSDGLTNVEGMLFFAIGILSVFGMLGWITYGAYGLASAPVEMARGRKSQGCCGKRDPKESSELDKNLRIVEESQRFLRASNRERDESAWPAEDRKKIQQLKKEEKSLKEKSGSSMSLNQDEEEGDCWSTCWNLCAPFRCVLAILFGLASLFVVISFVLSSIDMLVNSKCGAACGYRVESPEIQNPSDVALSALSQYFPMDFILFGFIACYLFVSSIHGLVMIGVRILCWKLYSMPPRRTQPHAVLMGSWMIMFVVLTLNMQILTFAPQYATFGNQFYYNQTLSASKLDCTLEVSIHNHTKGDFCKMTQIARIINTINVQTPFVGVVLFFANLAFVGFYCLFSLVAIFKPVSRTRVDAGKAYLDEDF